VTPFEISIIATANYTFLNYLVLLLGVLLLDDRFLEWISPLRFREWIRGKSAMAAASATGAAVVAPERTSARAEWRERFTPLRRLFAGACLGLVFYSTTALLLWMFMPGLPLPEAPVRALEPFRIANSYGLFAVMTHERYEIEFQGTVDGKTWVAYPFRYKPQAIDRAPGIYAPYQPRFVVWTEERLLKNDPDVLALFASNPFDSAPPREVRTVIYQYWFTDLQTKRATGNWWRREELRQYAPALEREADGKIVVLDLAEHEFDQP
jgi:hypothetical protein